MLLCRKTSSSSFWVSCGTHVMGYGSYRTDGYSVGQWTSMVIYLFYLVLALMLSLVLFCLFCLCFLPSSSFLALITVLCEIHIQGQPPDWEDFLGILFLLIVNSTIRFIEENNVGNAAAALMAHRAPKTKVCLQHLFDLCQSCCQGVVKWAQASRHGGQSWMRLSKTRSLLKLWGFFF